MQLDKFYWRKKDALSAGSLIHARSSTGDWKLNASGTGGTPRTRASGLLNVRVTVGVGRPLSPSARGAITARRWLAARRSQAHVNNAVRGQLYDPNWGKSWKVRQELITEADVAMYTQKRNQLERPSASRASAFK